MPTNSERLRHVTLKVRRAKDHISELERQVKAFVDTEPCEVGAKHEPQTRRLIYFVSRIEPTPEGLALTAGDAIQNLVTALDHLAYQLVCCDTADNPPNPKTIYFPIAEDLADYETKKRHKLKGARPRTLDAIDALKPYKGGNDLLWKLYRLNVVEKHRLLLTVASQAAGVNVSQDMARHMADSGFPPEAVAFCESLNIFVNPMDTGFPLKAGFHLYATGADEKPNPRQQFRFTVALNEPGVIEGEPLLKTLTEFAGAVEKVVTVLTPLLA